MTQFYQQKKNHQPVIPLNRVGSVANGSAFDQNENRTEFFLFLF